jgi:hypothetical protein
MLGDASDASGTNFSKRAALVAVTRPVFYFGFNSPYA